MLLLLFSLALITTPKTYTQDECISCTAIEMVYEGVGGALLLYVAKRLFTLWRRAPLNHTSMVVGLQSALCGGGGLFVVCSHAFNCVPQQLGFTE